MEQIEPQLLCVLLCTSKSLHDQLLQPRSCKQLAVSFEKLSDFKKATGFACWLGEYGCMVEALEVRMDGDVADEYSSELGQCISAGLRSLHQPTMCSLAVLVGSRSFIELAPKLFKSPGLRGLEELHLCLTGPRSLLHISQLTRLTNLSLGYTEKHRGDAEGLCLNCTAGVDDGVNVAPQWPVSLRRLRAAGIGGWPAPQFKMALAHLSNLTSLTYDPLIIDDASFELFPNLPAAPGMLELDLSGFECMSNVIPDRMPGLTKLVLGNISASDTTQYGYTRFFEELRDLRHLEIGSETCCFTAATSLEFLSWHLRHDCTREVARLSSLTSLTALTMRLGWWAVDRAVDVCRAVMGLSSSLSRLVCLELRDFNRRVACGHAQSVAFCWCFAPLTATSVWPQLQKLTVPRAWLTVDSASGAAAGAAGAVAGGQVADAHCSDMGQQLLAQLQELRPRLEVILK